MSIADTIRSQADRAGSGIGSLNLQSGSNYLNTLANKYIVKPVDAARIFSGEKGSSSWAAGFMFDVEDETQVSQQADITDHFLEDNTAVQDHIAIRPIKITLRGYVGELVHSQPSGVLGALSSIQNRLGAVPAYLGKYTPGVLQTIQKGINSARNAVNNINTAIAKVQNIVGFFGTKKLTKQQTAYAQLSAMMQSRQVFTVDTPYNRFVGMAIESLTFVQPGDTKSQSDVVVTLKQLRIAQTLVRPLSDQTKAQRAALQRTGQALQGRTKGSPQNVSLLYNYRHYGSIFGQ